jgi:VanZ family protein
MSWLTLPLKFAPRNLLFYSLAWPFWFTTLWLLSSRAGDLDPGLTIPHLDKLLHFSYFALGSALIAAALLLTGKSPCKTGWVVALCLFIGGVTGAIDEYHQSFVFGRTGNDLGDWIADSLGSLAGALYIVWLRKKKHETSTDPKNHSTSID